jgi:hypothetical protein
MKIIHTGPDDLPVRAWLDLCKFISQACIPGSIHAIGGHA